MESFRPALYHGVVSHARLAPFRHRFAYRVFALWLPLDDLEALESQSRWFGYRRRRLMQFDDRDHGLRDGSPIRPWLASIVEDSGHAMPDGQIMLLCYPRLLGYVFNPLTIYCLYRASGELAVVVYEVKNTFGEQHCYVMPLTPEQAGQNLIFQQCDKKFYVSPFLPMAGHYRFRLRQPDRDFSLLIRQFGADHEQLIACFTGKRMEWNDKNLWRMWWSHPLMTLKVMAGIHWEALHLWRKGAQYFRRKPHSLTLSTGHTDNQPR